MYTVTFYSFKGGVGRTMALVNIAVELARSGKSVLMVDFDLEAPGLQTFALSGVPKPQASLGIVDYVSSYLSRGEAPDAGTYLHEIGGVGQEGGQLWLMPAGIQNQEYSSKLNAIDWQNLYIEHDGYLMFEDLKEQWRQLINPHYVLIDSRTGHTDVGGICTRHLPDAVAILFFPNEQNLSGLIPITSEIRKESEVVGRKKRINLHFATSNIPDLDDEDQILQNRIAEFQKKLGYNRLSATIHHYNSLALLNQVVFTKDRPRSRLAAEYKQLLRNIIQDNSQDRDGALQYLQTLQRTARRNDGNGLSSAALESRLSEIEQAHPSDPAILRRLSEIFERQGQLEDALSLLDRSIATGAENPSIKLRRAELRWFNADLDGAVDEAVEVLQSEEISHYDVNKAIRILRALDPNRLEDVVDSPALTNLSTEHLTSVAKSLTRDYLSLPIAEKLLRRLFTEDVVNDLKDTDTSHNLTLCLIGLGKFQQAMEVMGPVRELLPDAPMSDIFNFAMAEWGITKRPPSDLFQMVVRADEEDQPQRRDANYDFCIAIALWGVGKNAQALERLQAASQSVMSDARTNLSPWRYLVISPSEFLQDLEQFRRLIDGEDVVPRLMGSQGDSND